MKNEIKNVQLTELQEELMVGGYAIRLASKKSNSELRLSPEEANSLALRLVDLAHTLDNLTQQQWEERRQQRLVIETPPDK